MRVSRNRGFQSCAVGNLPRGKFRSTRLVSPLRATTQRSPTSALVTYPGVRTVSLHFAKPRAAFQEKWLAHVRSRTAAFNVSVGQLPRGKFRRMRLVAPLRTDPGDRPARSSITPG